MSTDSPMTVPECERFAGSVLFEREEIARLAGRLYSGNWPDAKADLTRVAHEASVDYFSKPGREHTLATHVVNHCKWFLYGLRRSQVQDAKHSAEYVRRRNARRGHAYRERPLAEDERAELQAAIADALLTLPQRDRLVLKLRYGIGCPPRTLRQIALRFGCSASYVQHIEARALDRLAVFGSVNGLRHRALGDRRILDPVTTEPEPEPEPCNPAAPEWRDPDMPTLHEIRASLRYALRNGESIASIAKSCGVPGPCLRRVADDDRAGVRYEYGRQLAEWLRGNPRFYCRAPENPAAGAAGAA